MFIPPLPSPVGKWTDAVRDAFARDMRMSMLDKGVEDKVPFLKYYNSEAEK